MSQLDDLFQSLIDYYGNFAGDTFNIFRPNYNQVDNTPALIYENLVYREDPSSGIFAEPKFRDVGYYEIFGNRGLLQPGDILMKSTPDGGQTPPVTFLHSMPVKAATGFRSSRIGNLTNQKDEIIYENVYFDFLGSGYPGSSVNKKLEDSLKIPSVRVVLFARNNLFRLRTQLIETDNTAMINPDGGDPVPFQRKWKVEQIDRSGNIMILTLSNALKE